MKFHSIVWAIAAIGFAFPAQAQEWDMVQSTAGQTTANAAASQVQSSVQSTINPALLNGYSVAYPTTALNSTAATGSTGNVSSPTGSIGILPTRISNPTMTQTSGMGQLPHAGTMGLAPVFGTNNDGFTSPGGYVPPTIWIPGVGSFRIPTTIGVPGVSITAPPPSVYPMGPPGLPGLP